MLTITEADNLIVRERDEAEARERAVRVARAEASLAWDANYFAIPVDRAQHVIETSPADAWAEAFGGGVGGGRAASAFAQSFAALCCANGDHRLR